jgi:hypothetical protein
MKLETVAKGHTYGFYTYPERFSGRFRMCLRGLDLSIGFVSGRVTALYSGAKAVLGSANVWAASPEVLGEFL